MRGAAGIGASLPQGTISLGADGAAIFGDVGGARHAGVHRLGSENRRVEGSMIGAQSLAVVRKVRRHGQVDAVVAIGAGELVDLHGWPSGLVVIGKFKGGASPEAGGLLGLGIDRRAAGSRRLR